MISMRKKAKADHEYYNVFVYCQQFFLSWAIVYIYVDAGEYLIVKF